MAAQLREQRDKDLQRANSKTNLKMLARTVAHDQRCYGFLRGRRTSAEHHFTTTSAEWRAEPTRWQLQRSLDNLSGLAEKRWQRQQLARDYQEALLQTAASIPDQFGDSHVSIRVDSTQRDEIIAQLKEVGIDAGTLFPLASQLNASAFPNASAAAAEVINLPLHQRISQRAPIVVAATIKGVSSNPASASNTRTTDTSQAVKLSSR